jgi:anti-sigma factor ChrR (cupin superfamily)
VNDGRETHDDGERVALYALGALDAEETHAFEAHLAEGCPRCQSEIESHAAVARSLTFEPRPIAPPPDVRARVLATIAADAERERGYDFVHEDEGRWLEVAPGVLRKDLGGDAGFLLRMTPGSEVPHHEHSAVEHCYVMRGDLNVAGRELHVGDYHRAGVGSVHDIIRSRTGCLLLIVERVVAPGA